MEKVASAIILVGTAKSQVYPRKSWLLLMMLFGHK